MGKRILITGGAGFVGSYLADRLLEAGHYVRLLDNLTPQVHPNGLPDYLNPEAELIDADITDLTALRAAVRDTDVIFHLAAAVGVGQSMYEIAHYMGTNTQGTANLLQAILDDGLQIERLVVASSMSIYGEGSYRCHNCGVVSPPTRELKQLVAKRWEAACPTCNETLDPIPTGESKPLQSSSFYALSKKDQEEMCLLFGRTYELPVVALRFFNIYGPRQALSNPYTGVAAIFASRLLNGAAPAIFEDGRQMRDFVSVHDVVRANLLALESTNAIGEALNIGSGNPINILDVAKALSSALEIDIAPQVTGRYRAGDIRHCYADITAAKEKLGYWPQVSFQDGMTELVQWLKSQAARDEVDEALAQLETRGLSA